MLELTQTVTQMLQVFEVGFLTMFAAVLATAGYITAILPDYSTEGDSHEQQ